MYCAMATGFVGPHGETKWRNETCDGSERKRRKVEGAGLSCSGGGDGSCEGLVHTSHDVH